LLLREGHTVRIFDAHAERTPADKIKEHVYGFDKIFITSSALDRWQCPNLNIEPFLRAARLIRKENDELYVMGYHGTVNPDEILSLTGAKAIIRGQPEIGVLEICQNQSLSRIKGISYRSSGKIISTAERAVIDLDTLPVPAFHLVNFKYYFYEILGSNFALFEGSRGCTHGCTFCSKVMFGVTFRQKSPMRLMEEIDRAVRECKIKTGYFIDLDFTLNKKWVEEVCSLLIERNYDFEWCCQARLDEVDAPLLKKMKQAKCRLIHYGVETASDKMLRLAHKGLTTERITEGIRLTQEAGIKTLCFFMIGLSSDSREEMRQNMAFAHRLNPTYLHYHLAVSYGASCIQENSLNLPCDVSRRMIKHAIMKFYLRPRYIIQRLKQKEDRKAMLRQLKLLYAYIR